ncbi:MAG: aldehyde dehydrogenase [Verrucomicrobiaceae bacterium]|nr:aldehyde dehydrogenase [Verrucomicrobiaceae bacterium]
MNPPPIEPSLQAALDCQRAAFLADINPPAVVRMDRLQRLERLIERDADHFARQIAIDFGCRSKAEITITEILSVQGALRHARRHLKAWMKPRRVATGLRYLPGRCQLRPQPLGVIGILSPWNYPLLLALSPLVGVLAAGNRALLKPSELTPAFSEALRASIADFFEPEEVRVINGDAGVGRQFSALPFDHLIFTGSTAVGRQVAQAAARNLTPVTLELGGKSPAIIDVSCDLPAIIDRLAWGKLLNAGQTCIAPDYALVPWSRMEEFVNAFTQAAARLYPAFEANPDYTSIITERHYQRLTALVEDARAQGAIVTDLKPAGEPFPSPTRRLAPKILVKVTDSMRVMQEEIFGPLLPVVGYESLDEALSFIRRRDHPLALYWFGKNCRNREKVLSHTLSGAVTINDTLLHLVQDNLPFGGVGPSGQGHYHGEHGFRQFSKEKPVFIQSRFAAIRLFHPPYGPHLDRLLRWVKWL